jgi:hypothetical protein
MPLLTENPVGASDDLMPRISVSPRLVWTVAAIIAVLAVAGLISGLRQTPAGGLGVFGVGAEDSPVVDSTSAEQAKPLAGDKWSTLSGSQMSSAAQTAQSAAASAAPPSDQSAAQKSAAADEAPDAAPKPQAAPAPSPSTATSSQPDSMQNYY